MTTVKQLADLIRRMKDEGVSIRCESRCIQKEDWSGTFEPNPKGGGPPLIRIMHSHGYWLDASRHIEKFVTEIDDRDSTAAVLAHEFGHYKSYKSGTRTREYEAAILEFHAKKRLSCAKIQTLHREEITAWCNAKEFLNVVGIKLDVGKYRRQSLKDHKSRCEELSLQRDS